MPLIDVFCSRDFYPPDSPPATTQIWDINQRYVAELVRSIPTFVVENCGGLNLKPEDTPIEGVQVDIRKFHDLSQNTPDVWVRVIFAENYPGEDIAKQVRTTLVRFVMKWKEKHLLKLKGALDIFWGPEHGCLIPSTGPVTVTW